jgi:signal transduction histidine kinase
VPDGAAVAHRGDVQRALERLSHSLFAPPARLGERARRLRAGVNMRGISRALCLAGAAIGALAIVGWLTHSAWATRFVPGQPAMQPPAAIAALLVGLAGALKSEARSAPGQAMSRVAAIIALAIGTWTLLAYALGLRSSLEGFGFPPGEAPYANGVSPTTAAALVLLSVAILLADVRPRKRFRLAEWLALASGLIALTGLFAYLFGSAPSYRINGRVFATISLPSGVSLVLTSAGLVLSVAGGELVRVARSPGPGGVLFRRLAPITVLAPIVLGVLLSRSLSLLDVGFPIVYAALASGAMVAGFAILTATAWPLDRMHREIRWERDFFAEISTALTSSLECEATLAQMGELLVRELADTCIVDMVYDGGEVRRIVVAGRDPSTAWARDVLRTLLLQRDRPHIVFEALRARRPVLWESVGPELLAYFAQNCEHLRALRAVAPRSIIVVPLVVRDELLGAIALVSSAEGRAYGSHELGIAVEVARRTSLWLENVRLYRAAQRAIRDRDDVVGAIVHDLRNPLGTILLQAGLLGVSLGAQQLPRKPADVIERAARRMNRLIGDLLDVTCMEAGRLPLDCVELSPRQLVSEAVDSQRAQAEAAGLELRAEGAVDLPDVVGDRHRLLQAFENLIGNALKFTPPGGSVTVGAEERDGAVAFRVVDTGPGIGHDDVPHLFDRFWHKGDQRGAGLGLPIVKGIVDAHGGRIWVETEEGRGSAFWFTVPTAAAERDGPRVPADTPVSERTREG